MHTPKYLGSSTSTLTFQGVGHATVEAVRDQQSMENLKGKVVMRQDNLEAPEATAPRNLVSHYAYLLLDNTLSVSQR
jgi:hypothetical protein